MANKATLSQLDSVNHGMMASSEAVAHYSRSEQLSKAEAAALAAIAPEAKGRPILDLGVGGGRTVKSLRAVSDDYLGVDYAQTMVEAVSRRYPGVKFRYGDARDLAFLPDGSIFLVVFSCCGLGMVSHEDRLKILAEVRRVLAPGGAFLFNTHNLHRQDDQSPWRFRFPEIDLSLNPARMLVRGARFARSTVARVYNRWRLEPQSVRTPTYSILNDVCHNYGVFLYHITIDQQRIQLEEAGFAPNALAFDEDGQPITSDTVHSSICFLARKPKD